MVVLFRLFLKPPMVGRAKAQAERGPQGKMEGHAEHGFELVSVAEPDLMANDPTLILVRQMMGAVAQYEKSQIVLKLRGAAVRVFARANQRHWNV